MEKASDTNDNGSRSSVDANADYPVDDWDRWTSITKAIIPGLCWRRYDKAEEAGWSNAALVEAQRFSEKIGSAAVMVVFNGAVLAHWGRIERRFHVSFDPQKFAERALSGRPSSRAGST